MRIRTKRHEIMISPGKSAIRLCTPEILTDTFILGADERYLLVVLHDPAT
jgi:hypothetical protein